MDPRRALFIGLGARYYLALSGNLLHLGTLFKGALVGLRGRCSFGSSDSELPLLRRPITATEMDVTIT